MKIYPEITFGDNFAQNKLAMRAASEPFWNQEKSDSNPDGQADIGSGSAHHSHSQRVPESTYRVRLRFTVDQSANDFNSVKLISMNGGADK